VGQQPSVRDSGDGLQEPDGLVQSGASAGCSDTTIAPIGYPWARLSKSVTTSAASQTKSRRNGESRSRPSPAIRTRSATVRLLTRGR
jgi:hypothetical protein